MAVTNFAKLTNEQLTAWSRKFKRHMRNKEFVSKFTGDGEDAMIQRISELKKTSKGARAVMTLIAESKGDGVAGDRQLEGNEEELQSHEIVVTIDQLRHAHRHEGELADQKSVVNFRNEALNNLSYWKQDRRNQLAFLTLSGISYSKNTNGSDRVGSAFADLEYAADVTAPSAYRGFRWDATNGAERIAVSDNSNLVAADVPTYNMIIDIKAEAEYYKLKPIRTKDGIEFFHLFMNPLGIKQLKKDSEFRAVMRDAGVRGEMNPLFKGTNTIMLDGIAITPFHHVFHTKGAASGSKWGGGTVDGSRAILCGAQALGYADIGNPKWVEKTFDYDNQPGISVGSMFGFRKPVYECPVTGTDEDFGVMTIDHAI